MDKTTIIQINKPTRINILGYNNIKNSQIDLSVMSNSDLANLEGSNPILSSIIRTDEDDLKTFAHNIKMKNIN